jgi:5-methylcytosine-specific restriction endonuclease McrA
MKITAKIGAFSLAVLLVGCAVFCRTPQPAQPVETPTASYENYRGPDCCWCGSKEELNVHHVKPQHLGGTDDPANLATLCRDCHFVVGHARNWTNEVPCLREIIRLRRINAPER